MKKLFSLALALALVLSLFAACGNSAANPTEPAPSQPEETKPVVAATEPDPEITRDEALNIALEDAGFSREEVRDLEVELDNGHFDVDFEVKDQDYEYEIDVASGKILRKQVPAEKASSSSNQISRTEARDIALKDAGLTESQVRDLEVELDKDGGKAHYDVDFDADGYEYDYEVDAQTGKILKSKQEKD